MRVKRVIYQIFAWEFLFMDARSA